MGALSVSAILSSPLPLSLPSLPPFALIIPRAYFVLGIRDLKTEKGGGASEEIRKKSSDIAMPRFPPCNAAVLAVLMTSIIL